MAQDITKLEERVAHLQRVVDELSDVLASQDAELRRLSNRVKLLSDREAERDAQGGGGVIMGDERPPHW